MIKQNQRQLNQLNGVLDAFVAFLAMMLAFVVRFYWMDDGVISYGVAFHVLLALVNALLHVVVYAAMGFYKSMRSTRYYKEIWHIVVAESLCYAFLMSAFYIARLADFSRAMLGYSYLFGTALCIGKRMTVRLALRAYRRRGYNQKHVLLIGSGHVASDYLDMIDKHEEYGYRVMGYVSCDPGWQQAGYLGSYGELEGILQREQPDEAVVAMRAEDYVHMENVIQACEKTGTHLSIIPCYDRYISSCMQVEEVDGLNMVGIRSIPLDNLMNAAVKRATDIVGALILLVLTSPLMLLAAVGIKLTSPGPVIFKQKRVGKNKREFVMYKFRSMCMNAESDSAWSKNEDVRKTKFGAFLRKFSIDELPQFVNVLKGDMSLVGPRPEIPFYVDKFKEEVPLYMIKHYVRPGITGWAQVCGYRGDTSIAKRIEHDIYYIENWTWGFDLKILFLTLFRFANSERISPSGGARPL